MYTLRRISGNGIEMNHSLGDNYTVVQRNGNKQDFDRSFEAVFNEPYSETDEDGKKVYAFVSGNHGEILFPLYETHRNKEVSHIRKETQYHQALLILNLLIWIKIN